MTLHLSFSSMYKKVYEYLLKVKLLGLTHPVSIIFSLSLSLFQADPLEHRGSLHSLICPGFQDLNGKMFCVFTPSGDREGTCGLREQGKLLVLKFYWFSM